MGDYGNHGWSQYDGGAGGSTTTYVSAFLSSGFGLPASQEPLHRIVSTPQAPSLPPNHHPPPTTYAGAAWATATPASGAFPHPPAPPPRRRKAKHHRKRHVPVGPAGLWFLSQQQQQESQKRRKSTTEKENNHPDTLETIDAEDDTTTANASSKSSKSKVPALFYSPAWTAMQCQLQWMPPPFLPPSTIQTNFSVLERYQEWKKHLLPGFISLLDLWEPPRRHPSSSELRPWLLGHACPNLMVLVERLIQKTQEGDLWTAILTDETGATLEAWLDVRTVQEELQRSNNNPHHPAAAAQQQLTTNSDSSESGSHGDDSPSRAANAASATTFLQAGNVWQLQNVVPLVHSPTTPAGLMGPESDDHNVSSSTANAQRSHWQTLVESDSSTSGTEGGGTSSFSDRRPPHIPRLILVGRCNLVQFWTPADLAAIPDEQYVQWMERRQQHNQQSPPSQRHPQTSPQQQNQGALQPSQVRSTVSNTTTTRSRVSFSQQSSPDRRNLLSRPLLQDPLLSRTKFTPSRIPPMEVPSRIQPITFASPKKSTNTTTRPSTDFSSMAYPSSSQPSRASTAATEATSTQQDVRNTRHSRIIQAGTSSAANLTQQPSHPPSSHEVLERPTTQAQQNISAQLNPPPKQFHNAANSKVPEIQVPATDRRPSIPPAMAVSSSGKSEIQEPRFDCSPRKLAETASQKDLPKSSTVVHKDTIAAQGSSTSPRSPRRDTSAQLWQSIMGMSQISPFGDEPETDDDDSIAGKLGSGQGANRFTGSASSQPSRCQDEERNISNLTSPSSKSNEKRNPQCQHNPKPKAISLFSNLALVDDADLLSLASEEGIT